MNNGARLQSCSFIPVLTSTSIKNKYSRNVMQKQPILFFTPDFNNPSVGQVNNCSFSRPQFSLIITLQEKIILWMSTENNSEINVLKFLRIYKPYFQIEDSNSYFLNMYQALVASKKLLC